jgi:tetratricopeptide (TPR) repeat protein
MHRPFRITAAGLTLVTLTASTGCGGLSGGAVQQVDQARVALAGGRYDRAEQLLTPVIRAHGAHRDAAPAYYLRGQCRIQTGARDAARQDLHTALRLAGDPVLSAQVEAQLGNMAFDDEAYGIACGHYARAGGRLPRAAPADRVFFQHGVALQRAGRFADARKAYANLLQAFPGSPLAGAARRKQAWDDSHFTIQCGVFAQEASARQVAATLRARGLDTLTAPEIHGARRVFAVRAGRFPTYPDAARQLDRVRAVAADAFIVP